MPHRRSFCESNARARTPCGIGLRDGSPVVPNVNHAKPEDESGRGIFLVDDISDEWGAEPTVDGKLTWFRLDN